MKTNKTKPRTVPTYSEEKLARPFDWFEFLEAPKHTPHEWDVAESMATRWMTCAVGSQCSIIPRNQDGRPDDLKLQTLGHQFFDQIQDRKKSMALRTLHKIEERSIEVIRQIAKTAAAALEEYCK